MGRWLSHSDQKSGFLKISVQVDHREGWRSFLKGIQMITSAGFALNGHQYFNAEKPLFMMDVVAKGWRLQALKPGTTGPGVVRFSLDKYYLVKMWSVR